MEEIHFKLKGAAKQQENHPFVLLRNEWESKQQRERGKEEWTGKKATNTKEKRGKSPAARARERKRKKKKRANEGEKREKPRGESLRAGHRTSIGAPHLDAIQDDGACHRHNIVLLREKCLKQRAQRRRQVLTI